MTLTAATALRFGAFDFSGTSADFFGFFFSTTNLSLSFVEELTPERRGRSVVL